MFYQNWKLALFAILMMPLVQVLQRAYKKNRKSCCEVESFGKLTSFLSEIYIKNDKNLSKENEESLNANKIINDLVENIKINSVLVRACQ